MISFGKWFVLLGILGVVFMAVMVGGVVPTRLLGDPSRPIESWIKLEPARPVLGERDELPRAEQLARLRQTATTLIRSPNVLSAAVMADQVRSLPLVLKSPDPIGWLGARIHVDERSDEILCISMVDAPREEQALIVNAVTEAYIDAVRDWESSAQAKRLEAATQAYASSRGTLVELRKVLREPKGLDPEQVAAIRDEIGVQEEMVHRLGVLVEQRRLETAQPETVRVITQARP